MKQWNACGMFVTEQLLFTTRQNKDGDACNKRHVLMFLWYELDLFFHVYNKRRRQWTVNILYHKLRFFSLHPVFSVSSNLACTVYVTQWQRVDVKFVSLMEVYFQCNLAVEDGRHSHITVVFVLLSVLCVMQEKKRRKWKKNTQLFESLLKQKPETQKSDPLKIYDKHDFKTFFIHLTEILTQQALKAYLFAVASWQC